MKKYFGKVIGLEEHFLAPDKISKKYRSSSVFSYAEASEFSKRLLDLGPLRISEMDEAGIDLQVLSLSAPGTEQMDPEEAASFSREVNEYIADTIKNYPGRFAAFATIPTPYPEKAADELERAVKQLGFKGAVVNGHTRGRYLDDASFEPILQRAEELGAPIYLHPTVPPSTVSETYYSRGLKKEVVYAFSTAGFGWHIETAVHILRLVLAGVFDRHPKLQFIIGHLGEGLPFMMERLDTRMPKELTALQKPISGYLKENIYYTISGFNFVPVFLDLYLHVGAERIMFSTDYPYSSMKAAVQFLRQLPISDNDKEKIAHVNAEKFLHF